MIKIWLDDIRPLPPNYTHLAHSVNEAKKIVINAEQNNKTISIIDCDHDLGDYAHDGGDGIKLLDWLVERNTLYPIQLHTQNPVEKMNMQRTLNRYW